MEWVFALVGFLAGAVAAFLWLQRERKGYIARETLELSERARAEADAKLMGLERERADLSKRLGALEAERDLLLSKTKEMQTQMARDFENLANKILETNSTRFRESSEKNLETVLRPLREKIQEFQKRVEESYSHESREIFSLKNEVQKMVEANQKMSLETNRLSTVLKGDVKTQGAWGELVLERVLEASGLREGEEYVVQGVDMKLRSEEGRHQKPDVILNLPEGKHLIVDSKVSLTHYERLMTEADGEARDAVVKLFLQSLYQHIEGLASKNYQDLPGLKSPDFVMMFVPMEGAFATALQADGQIFLRAWDRRIVLVSPTTLLATLRTVASLWNQERQNKNAMEIARQGGQLYDKFVGFVEDLRGVGESLGRSQSLYEGLMNKLSSGKGNLVGRVERLRQLGAKVSKEMPDELVHEAEE